MSAMTRPPTSRLIEDVVARLGPMQRFFAEETPRVRERFGGDVCDFAAGNPQEGAIEGYVRALERAAPDRLPDWFAYKMSEPEAQDVVARSLSGYLGVPFEADDIALTNASIAALAVTLRALCEPGDEVITISPPHFLYAALIVAAGAVPVPVPIDRTSLDLDLPAIEAAITPRTRAIIVNTPHNPTGKIFPSETLDGLARILEAASRRGDPIIVISDEAYHRILFDGRTFVSPAACYERTLVVYSYGKVLLAPGQRLGFIAVSPRMPERDAVRRGLIVAQIVTGWAFPNALLQHAIADLDALTVDMAKLQSRRDRMVGVLREMGYELHVPEATFYLMPRSPIEDDAAFCSGLMEDGIIAMPGSFLDLPGFFRLSLTASDAMIERSLPGFANAIERARAPV
jgi:aspartate aminotransferase